MWAYQNPGDDAWWVCAEEDDTRLTDEQLAAWCRRVLREVDPDPVPTVDEVMEAWGIDDLVIHIPRHRDGSSSVCVNSDTVMMRFCDLYSAGHCPPTTDSRTGSLLGKGPTHAEALRNALANAAGPWGDLP